MNIVDRKQNPRIFLLNPGILLRWDFDNGVRIIMRKRIPGYF